MKLLEIMKNLYQKVKAFAITVVKGILALFRKHSELAVIITANLKKAVESPIADGVVTIIQTYVLLSG
jgi:hypothetical protein